MGECLLAERDRFMELLAGERGERAHLEGFACCRIQAAYRGYLLRNRFVVDDLPGSRSYSLSIHPSSQGECVEHNVRIRSSINVRSNLASPCVNE